MFDFSFAEILLIVIVIVVFIQPKDIPVVIRAAAKAVATMRGFVQELKGVFDDIAKETGVTDIKETLDAEIRLIQGDDGQMYESYQVPEIKKKPDDTK